MDWPHDPDGERGSEAGRKYGLAILAKKVDEEEDFPLDVDEFVADHADEPIRTNHDRVVSVSDIFEHTDAGTAETITEFHRIAGRAIRAGGFWDFAPAVASERSA